MQYGRWREATMWFVSTTAGRMNLLSKEDEGAEPNGLGVKLVDRPQESPTIATWFQHPWRHSVIDAMKNLQEILWNAKYKGA